MIKNQWSTSTNHQQNKKNLLALHEKTWLIQKAQKQRNHKRC